MICKNCSKEIADDANFCNGCGARVEIPVSEPVVEVTATVAEDTAGNFEEEQKCLDLLVRMTKFQSVAYKVVAIVFAAILALYDLFFIVMGLGVWTSGGESAFFGIVLVFVYPFFFTVSMLPVVIGNWIMAKKTASYYKDAYKDCTLVVSHLGNVGSIVIAGIFNTIAAVFEVIGFVHIKTHKNTVERIKKNQGV